MNNAICCNHYVDTKFEQIFPKQWEKLEKCISKIKKWEKLFEYDTPFTISFLLFRETLEMIFQS